ncbi:hypothetical protein L7F22_049475 [Adiantum nelumboides]|nr:hypothetical protein [Adiantum nelumboides]
MSLWAVSHGLVGFVQSAMVGRPFGTGILIDRKSRKVTVDQVRAIATEKLPDLNCSTIESAMRIIAGTAANMGIDIDPPLLKKKERVAF